MASKIEWTDDVWNPTVGCSRVSEGCDRCYAMTLAHRGMTPAHRGLTVMTDHGVDWTGEIRPVPDRLDQPLRWKRPRRIFVDSMSDLFHPDALKLMVPEPWPHPFLADVFATMVAAKQHSFQVLTKRPRVAAAVLSEPHFALDVNALLLQGGHEVMPGGMSHQVWPANIWGGVSVELDKYMFRVDQLRAAPYSIRFLSLEPLLGPLPSLDLTDIDWVIVGGESGPGARRMSLRWALDIKAQCRAAGVPFFFKQTGSVLARELGLSASKGDDIAEWTPGLQCHEYPV